MDFTLDDSFLLSGSADETVMVWSMEESLDRDSGEAANALSYGPSFDVKFFFDGRGRMVTPDDVNTVQVNKLLNYASSHRAYIS